MSEIETKWFPIVALQNLVLLPGTNVHLDIDNRAFVSAVNAAMEQDQEMVVFSYKESVEKGSLKQEQLCPVGTKVKVRQMLKLPKGVVRILLGVEYRVILKQINRVAEYHIAEVEECEQRETEMDAQEKEARLRMVKDLVKQCGEAGIIYNPVIISALQKLDQLELLVDLTAEAVPLQTAYKQELLCILDPIERSERLNEILLNEIRIHQIRMDLTGKLKECVDKNQREYVLREQMKLIKQELGEDDTEDEGERYRRLLNEADPPEEVKEKLEKEIKRFCSLPYASSESAVIRNYIETLLEYPWNKEGEDNQDLKKAIEQLEQDHYGLKKIKERIIDYLAVRTLSNRKDAPILCLVGPPGTGKTSVAKSIASALHKKYGRIALGGVRDEAEIRGHRKTYIGAMPGRIVTVISQTGVNNPLILLDEIDKTSGDHRGDTASALLEVLDGEQNIHFQDHYFEVPVDLSNVLFVATANDASAIPEALRDRMEMIEVNSYTENEKFHIASMYLLPKQLKKNGLKKSQFKITDEAIYRMIRCYTREAGVRTLERTLGVLMQKAARGILTEEFKSLKVTPKKLETLLGVPKYDPDVKNIEDKIGVVTGLAWTRVGGDTLNVEVNLLEGKGGLTITGNLGDVMKESAQIALSYVRTLPEVRRLPEEYFEKHIVHIHVPEGATPKDGPSAGITMALAMYSALLKRPVCGTIAMTGEITLKGNVLPIGGLKEKLLAAKNAGMKKVLVPAENRKNVEELESEITEGMEICYVSRMEEVIRHSVKKQMFTLKQEEKG